MRSTRTQNGACQLLFQVTFPFRGNSSACPVGIQQPLCVAGVEAYGTQSLDLSLLSLYQVLGLLNKAINGSELLRETGVRPRLRRCRWHLENLVQRTNAPETTGVPAKKLFLPHFPIVKVQSGVGLQQKEYWHAVRCPYQRDGAPAPTKLGSV
jgi:hypothetical protein